jgi:aryl-alcohol dehydrogenase-like predicted oxidoreductase
MGMSEFYGASDEVESIATIQRALSLGVNFLDTADMYGVGGNEELVGRAIRDRRDQVILATKFGNVRGAKGEFLGVNGRPEYLKRACEASLQRLGLEHIDLYYQHTMKLRRVALPAFGDKGPDQRTDRRARHRSLAAQPCVPQRQSLHPGP